ncbi:MAG: sigma-54-dependent transcriptional regulator [Fibrobacterota bacterium]
MENGKERISSKHIWIVEDDRALGMLLKEEVEEAGYTAEWINTAEEALRKAALELPSLIVSDLRLPGMGGMELMGKIKNVYHTAVPGFLIITAFGTIPKAIEALKNGADDFLTKPLDLEHFILCIKRIFRKNKLVQTVDRMRGLFSDTFHGMYGRSHAMLRLYEQIKRVSRARGPVLITGESGTGKEMVARAVHNESERKNGPFLPVNCAGVPEHLLESEFLGYSEGAFTGAVKERRGLFAEADGGSILLDEISEMPVFLQAKLLRILQDGKLRKIGENREREVNVRIIASTNRNLADLVDSGEFRKDLFFRLETFCLDVPLLRERQGDIELLAGKFLYQFGLVLNKEFSGFSGEAMELLRSYNYPGNVRELKNIIEHAAVFSAKKYIGPEDLPEKLSENRGVERSGKTMDYSGYQENHLFGKSRLLSLNEMEKKYIDHVLKEVDGNKQKAASILKIGRKTLYRKLGRGAVDNGV